MRRLSACVLIALLATSPSWGWWETGHRVVARLAAARLTPAARTRVARILNVPDTVDAVTGGLADASIWADEVKKSNATASWHFIDLAIQDKRADIAERCPDDNCLPAKIQLFTAQLKEHPANPQWTELDALRFLVHFIGDGHQPLHAATDSDEGGNCEKLAAPFETAKNLHALWDGGIIRSMDTDDVHLAADLNNEIDRMNEHHRRRLMAGSVSDWIWESHELALHDIYYKLHVPVEGPGFPHGCETAPADIRNFTLAVDPAYVAAMTPVVRLQLIKGGLRLARVLNETL